MIVNLNLSAETAKRLSDKAAQEGHTLEDLLQDLAEHEANSSANGRSAVGNSLENEERPWRGVFVLDYPHPETVKIQQEVNINTLPALPAEIVIDPRT
jgi:hypothetical protein